MTLSRLGFFKFVDGYDAPVKALRNALSEVEGQIAGALVVLPEAFNIGRFYRDAGPCNYDPSILCDLQSLAATYRIQFVAGLVIESPDGPNPPFNSAFFIDGQGSTLICRKHKSDGYSASTPCIDGFDVNNPLVVDGVSIGALICMDCDDPSRERVLAAGLAASSDCKVVCIPACMNKVYGAEAIARSWPKHFVVLCNSDPHGCRSFISKDGSIVLDDSGHTGNRIVWWTLADAP